MDNVNSANPDKPEKTPAANVDPSNPDTIPKFIDDLPRPPVVDPIKHCKNIPYYVIEMQEATHRFHKYFPPSTIWGYEGIYPGPTFDVMKDQTIMVKWVNNLPLKHFLPIDHTLHGAIDSPEVRTVVHLHGANVDSDSDGHPDAWFTRHYALTGHTFKRKIYKYTNHQQAATLWYHDHSLGITRLNVYAGLTGLYIIRDSLENRLNLPAGKYEIPLLIQDRTFNEDGSLFYPDGPPFPVEVKPSVVPAFLGNTIVVNGRVWPRLKVEPRKYRFRVLNGSNTRGYNLTLSNSQDFFLIGTDGGLLDKSVSLKSISLEPAERCDIIIDFSELKNQKITLMNSEDTSPHTGVVMQFKVVLPLENEDTSQIPKTLYPAGHMEHHMAHKTRFMTLSAKTDDYGRPMLLLNNLMWNDPVTEKPAFDSIEEWNILNLTAFPHPVHVHLVQFKILDRRPINVQIYEETGIIKYTGPAEEPKEYERGWKDTVKVEPGMNTRIIMHFKDHSGDYVWHCHILEHEDHDMMRPIRIIRDCYHVHD
jgi:spore coat protein A